MRASTNDYQSARESSTPSSLPDLESIPETDFEDEEDFLNPEFYPTWWHGELHINYTPSTKPENHLDEDLERRRRLQDLWHNDDLYLTQQSRARLLHEFKLPDSPSNLTLQFMAQWVQDKA